MNFSSKLSVVAMLFSAYSVTALDQAAYNATQALLQRYKRPITVLEICGNDTQTPIYARRFEYPQKSVSTSVVILVSKTKDTAIVSSDAKRLMEQKVSRTLILAPEFTLEKAAILGKVEQPDVVLVHGLPHDFLKPCAGFKSTEHSRAINKDFVYTMLGIGDYLALDLAPHEVCFFVPHYSSDSRIITTVPHENGDGGLFVLFKTGKPGLRLARWDQVLHCKKPKISYNITSNFEKKYLEKPQLKAKSDWLPGINLETFVVLWGVYPALKDIGHTISKRFASYSHNDFVLGNLVIQGSNDIVAIDHDDSRRSASFKKHYTAIVDSFKKCGAEKFMACYHGLLGH